MEYDTQRNQLFKFTCNEMTEFYKIEIEKVILIVEDFFAEDKISLHTEKFKLFFNNLIISDDADDAYKNLLKKDYGISQEIKKTNTYEKLFKIIYAFEILLNESHSVSIDLTSYIEKFNNFQKEMYKEEVLFEWDISEKYKTIHAIDEGTFAKIHDVLYPVKKNILTKNFEDFDKILSDLVNEKEVTISIPSNLILRKNKICYNFPNVELLELIYLCFINHNLLEGADYIEDIKSELFISPYCKDLMYDEGFLFQERAANYVMKMFRNDNFKKAILVLDNNFLESKKSLNFRTEVAANKLVKNIIFFPDNYFDERTNSFAILLLEKLDHNKVQLIDLNHFKQINDKTNITNIDSKSLEVELSNKVFTNKIFHQNFAQFETYFKNFQDLKYNIYRNIDLQQLVQISSFISLDKAFLKKGWCKKKIYIDGMKQSSLNSIYINPDFKSKSSITKNCTPLIKNMLYLDICSPKLMPKIYEGYNENQFIDGGYFPFQIKDKKNQKEYLIEFLRNNIDYKRFTIDYEEYHNNNPKMLAEKLEQINVIVPSLFEQQSFVIDSYSKSIEQLDKQNSYLREIELENENETLLIRWLKHNLETSLGELRNLPSELKDVFKSIKENNLSNKIDFNSDDIDNVKYHINKINTDLEIFYSKSIFDLNLSDINLIDLVDEFKRSITEDGFKLEVEKKSVIRNNSVISCDKNLINDVLAYLLNNAKQHAFRDENNKILIQLSYESNKIVLSFLNTGVPFSKAINLKEFITLDKTTKFKSGGFGGFQVYRIIRKHNAELRLIKLSDEYSSQNYVTKIDLVFNIKFTK